VHGKRPKMIAVQASGCAPVAKAFQQGEQISQMWPNAHTWAAGLRVPKPYGDYLILDIVRQSGGLVVDVNDQQILDSVLDWGQKEGLFLSPEGAAATAAYDQLIGSGQLKPEDRVVLFNTGAGLKYVDATATAMKLERPATGETDHRGMRLPAKQLVGGIITPQ
jgi:threonine synthase